MRGKHHPAISAALVPALALFVLIHGCGDNPSGTGGEGVSSLTEARAITDPIAADWGSQFLFCYCASGIFVDENGLLIPETEMGESAWGITYGDYTSNMSLYVGVTYTGQILELEYPIPISGLGAIPDYTDQHVDFLMGVATATIEGQFGSGDYMYHLDVFTGVLEGGGFPFPNVAKVWAFEMDEDVSFCWVILNADTGEVHDTTWW